MQHHVVELRKDEYQIPGILSDDVIISEEREKNFEERRHYDIDPFQIVTPEHETTNIPMIPRKILCLFLPNLSVGGKSFPFLFYIFFNVLSSISKFNSFKTCLIENRISAILPIFSKF